MFIGFFVKLELTPYHSPSNLLLDTPFSDGIANLKAAFQESKKIPFESVNSQQRRITEEVPDRSLSDKVKQVFAGLLLLIPAVNIVIDLALRYFDHMQKMQEDDHYCSNMSTRGADLLSGCNVARIPGSERGLRDVLDRVITPQVSQRLGNTSFQYTLSPDHDIEPMTGSSSRFLHMRITNEGKSIEWRRRVFSWTDSEFHNNVSEREIVQDIFSKWVELKRDSFWTFAWKLLQGKPVRVS